MRWSSSSHASSILKKETWEIEYEGMSCTLVNISSTLGCIPVHCSLLVNVKENLSSLIECLFDDFRNRDVTDSELLNYVSPKVSVNDFTDHFTTR